VNNKNSELQFVGMPFQSKAQMRKCFALQKNGDSTWDCKKTYRETPNYKDLPDHKVFTGPKGGKYTLKNGVKHYIKQNF
jgi:hypothetical protein